MMFIAITIWLKQLLISGLKLYDIKVNQQDQNGQ